MNDAVMKSWSIPKLYSYKVKTHLGKKLLRFTLWTLFTWYSACVLFYIPFFVLSDEISPSGLNGNLEF